MSKKKLDTLTKTKLLIQGEYLLIAVLFLVFGILKLLNIMKSNETRSHVFIIITFIGSIWVISDFIWSTFSKKRRAKVTYLDKIIMLPFGLWMFTYDLYSIIVWNNALTWYQYGIGSSFIAVSILYGFQAIYHWFVPTKAVLEIVREEEKEKLQDVAQKLDDKNEKE